MGPVEAEGDSIDAAIEAALKILGVSRDRVEIEILSNAARGLFGIGGHKAKVRATLRPPIGEEPAPEPAPEPVELTPSDSPTRAENLDARVAEQARTVLQQIVQHMGIDADVIATTQEDHLLLELTGDSSGVLIGRRGQMLDAIEYLLNRMVARDTRAPTRIVVDSQGYRSRRRESLEELARRIGEEAKKKQKPIPLAAMSPRDRRIVHMAIRHDTTLTTKSSGKGYFRRLIIIPEGSGRPRRSQG